MVWNPLSCKYNVNDSVAVEVIPPTGWYLCAITLYFISGIYVSKGALDL